MKDRKHIIKASIIVLTFIFAISSKAQVPAFTSAEGFGKFATGGRGGQVVSSRQPRIMLQEKHR